MVTSHEHFTISKDYVKKVIEILEAKSKSQTKSDFICRAVIKLDELEHVKKIDDFAQQPNTELDTAPRVHEPITKDYLKTLSPKDVMRIRKMVYWNKKILDDYFETYNNQYFSKLRGDVSMHDY